MSANLGFVHRIVPATRHDTAPLLLLHGTGGDENDLLPLAELVAPGAAVLSVRGKVLENGMLRFFRRLAEGVFDEADVTARAHELADFIDAARRHYDLPAPMAVGYSNGANIAAALLLLRPQSLRGGVLMRAMVPLSAPPRPDLAGKAVLMLSGAQDPIVPPANGERLAALLVDAGADVERHVVPVGHQLSQGDVGLAQRWFGRVARATPDLPSGGMGVPV